MVFCTWDCWESCSLGKTRFRDLGRALKKVKAKKSKLVIPFLIGIIFTVNAQEHSNDDGHDHGAMPTQEQVRLCFVGNFGAKRTRREVRKTYYSRRRGADETHQYVFLRIVAEVKPRG